MTFSKSENLTDTITAITRALNLFYDEECRRYQMEQELAAGTAAECFGCGRRPNGEGYDKSWHKG